MKKPPLEKFIVNKTLEMIKSRGGFAVKIHGSPFQIMGLPDILGCYRGRFFAFEVKRDETKPTTKLQAYYLKRIRMAGGVATRTHTVEMAEAALDRIDGDEARTEPPQS